MVEEQSKSIEREYIIPLRREFLKVPGYRRAGRAAKAIKQFIAKHMKVPERDIGKVKMDIYLNSEIWFRGKVNPPSRIRVKAIKEGDIIKVTLAETPEHIKFAKIKHEKFHREAAKEEKKEEVAEKKEEKPVSEEKKEEKEKEKAVEKEQIKEAKKDKLAEKHVTKVKEAEIHRTALNRH